MAEGHAKPGEPGWNDPTARLPRRERRGYEKPSTVSIVSSAGGFNGDSDAVPTLSQSLNHHWFQAMVS
jgi:hypothetical protein